MEECCIINSTFIGFEEISCYWSIQFFSAFYKSTAIGKSRMIPVSFVKTTESYEVSLITINRQNSDDSDILCHDYEIMRGEPKNHTRFATIWKVCLPERTEMGGPNYRIGLDCAVGPCIAAIASFIY